jgi:hypothetical protein
MRVKQFTIMDQLVVAYRVPPSPALFRLHSERRNGAQVPHMREGRIAHEPTLSQFLIFCNEFVVQAFPLSRLNPLDSPIA